jgi:hypothetical protein
MPLRSTAVRNGGLCGVCQRDKEYRELQQSRERFLANPPNSQEEIDALAPRGDIANLGLRLFLDSIRPPLLNPQSSSHADFEREVHRLAEKYPADRERAVHEFMHLCEPFSVGSSYARSAFEKIPRPYREMYALLCAWGTVGSDGFGSYVRTYPEWWDSEADMALEFFGFDQSRGALGESRKLLEQYEDELPERAQNELWSRFYEPIKKFDRDVLGAFLQRRGSDRRA